MNQFVPDWSNMGDTSRPLGEDDDLIELLWCNGHVVMQSQTNRKLPPRPEKATVPAPPPPAPVAQEDEAGLWFPFALADSLDKDIFSEFFCEAPAAPVPTADAGVEPGKPCRDAPAEDDGRRGGGACAVSEAPCELMPPPKSTPVSGSRQQTMSLADGGDNTGDLSDLVRAGGKAAEAGASSMLSAMGSSICGSNQVLVQRARPGQRGHGGVLVGAFQLLLRHHHDGHRADEHQQPEQQAQAARHRGLREPQRGRRVGVRRDAGAQAAAEADDGAEEPRRRGAQPLREEETRQDQREDESPARAHTSLQQDRQGVNAGRGHRVPQVAAAAGADDVDGQQHRGAAGDVPGRAPVPAADGRRDGRGGDAVHAADAVHGAQRARQPGAAHAGGGRHHRALRALPRRQPPPAADAAAGPELLPAGDEGRAAGPSAPSRAGRRHAGGRRRARGDAPGKRSKQRTRMTNKKRTNHMAGLMF